MSRKRRNWVVAACAISLSLVVAWRLTDRVEERVSFRGWVENDLKYAPFVFPTGSIDPTMVLEMDSTGADNFRIAANPGQCIQIDNFRTLAVSLPTGEFWDSAEAGFGLSMLDIPASLSGKVGAAGSFKVSVGAARRRDVTSVDIGRAFGTLPAACSDLRSRPQSFLVIQSVLEVSGLRFDLQLKREAGVEAELNQSREVTTGNLKFDWSSGSTLSLQTSGATWYAIGFLEATVEGFRDAAGNAAVRPVIKDTTSIKPRKVTVLRKLPATTSVNRGVIAPVTRER